jgi:hypothetical protein
MTKTSKLLASNHCLLETDKLLNQIERTVFFQISNIEWPFIFSNKFTNFALTEP